MTSEQRRKFLLYCTGFNPYTQPNLQLRYDLSDLSSLIYDGSDRVALLGDKSGNSAVNGLVLNGVAGNNAGTPDSVALSPTTGVDIDGWVTPTTWSQDGTIAVSDNESGTVGNRRCVFRLLASGALRFAWYPDGLTASVISQDSTLPVPFAAFAAGFVRVRFNGNDGGVYSVTFYTSTDGATWTQLGSAATGGAPSVLFDSNQPWRFGAGIFNSGSNNMFSGIVHRVRIRALDGTVLCAPDFTLQSKGATSFTESSVNAATVTINTSGDTGARICGARDGFQFTTSKKGFLTLSGSGSYVTEDGINDYYKSAPYARAQSLTRYTVFRANAWSSGAILWDGNAASSCKLTQTGTTPNLQLNAGSAGPALNTFTLGAFAVIAEVISGASSTLGRNLDARTAAADAGSTAPNGTTIGADGAGANPASMAWMKRLEYGVAHDAATQLKIAKFLLRESNLG